VRSAPGPFATPQGDGSNVAVEGIERPDPIHQWNMVPSPRRATGKLAGT
jgi:hypothetical protein